MVSAIRYINRFDKVNTGYFIKDIVDFTNKKKRGQKRGRHYCYPLHVHKTLR